MTPMGLRKIDLPAEPGPVPRPEPAYWPVGEEPVTFTLTANAGMLAEYDGVKILVDGLHGGAEAFSGVPADLMERMIAGRPPFSRIDWLLYTHLHEDHFSAQATGRFLACNPQARLILPAEKGRADVEALCAALQARDARSRVLEPPAKAFLEVPLGARVLLRAFAARHAGEAYRQVSLMCFLLSFGARNVLFLGDADYDADFFARMLRGIPVHAAVVNPLFVSAAKGRRTLLDGVRPQRILVNHIPFQGEDPMRFRQMTARCLERYKHSLPPAAVLWNALDTTVL